MPIFSVSLSLIIAVQLIYPMQPGPKKFTPTLASLHVHTIIPETIAHAPSPQLSEVTFAQLVSDIQANKAPSACTLKIRNTKRKATVYKGIAPELAHYDTIFIVSRGYAKRDVVFEDDYLELVNKGGGIVAAHMMLKDRIVTNAVCVTFDYPDERAHFNFAQDLDIQCLQTVYDAVLHAHPNARIVGLGDCRGAKALLALAAKRPKNLAGLVLVAPFVSTLDMVQQLSLNYLPLLPKSDIILHNLFKFYFPLYNHNKDTLLSEVHTIDPQLPIFIGLRKNDYLISETSVCKLVEKLKNAGNNSVHTITVSDNNATHSRITPIVELRLAIQDFLHKYQLKTEDLQDFSTELPEPIKRKPFFSVNRSVGIVATGIALLAAYQWYYGTITQTNPI